MGKTTVTEPAADVADQPPAAQPAAEPTWPEDEFTGKGGNYVRDPVTGVRSPAPVIPE